MQANEANEVRCRSWTRGEIFLVVALGVISFTVLAVAFLIWWVLPK